MEMPQFGQQNQNYNYQVPNDPGVKKKLILFGAGVTVLLVALVLVLTSGGSNAGQESMQKSLQSTSEALGIIDEYESKLTHSPTKNDVALVQILLRGNFEKINELYTTTYKPKKKISNSPKVDSDSKETLDRSLRNNTLDSDILTELEPKIIAARKQLTETRSSFKKRDSVEKIKVSIEDLSSIEEILSSAR
jgi:hypothetical protein